MGFYRFILAIGVVYFHVGNGNWVIGRAAVYCFYFVSGFLICRVLDTSYRGGADRLAAFYANRLCACCPFISSSLSSPSSCSTCAARRSSCATGKRSRC